MRQISIRKWRNILNALLIITSLWLISTICSPSCTSYSFTNQLPQMLPPNYYYCYEITPDQFEALYFAPMAQPWLAQARYGGAVFVFKNIVVNKSMLKVSEPNTLWVNKIICHAVAPDEIHKLKLGQSYDIVGVNRGVSPDWRNCVYLTECYFLSAGSLALPIGDAPAFGGGGY
jgi:hypothetical protein